MENPRSYLHILLGEIPISIIRILRKSNKKTPIFTITLWLFTLWNIAHLSFIVSDDLQCGPLQL